MGKPNAIPFCVMIDDLISVFKISLISCNLCFSFVCSIFFPLYKCIFSIEKYFRDPIENNVPKKIVPRTIFFSNLCGTINISRIFRCVPGFTSINMHTFLSSKYVNHTKCFLPLGIITYKSLKTFLWIFS